MQEQARTIVAARCFQVDTILVLFCQPRKSPDQGILVQRQVRVAAGLVQSAASDAALLTQANLKLLLGKEIVDIPNAHFHVPRILIRDLESLTSTTLVGKMEVRDFRPCAENAHDCVTNMLWQHCRPAR